MKTAMAIAMATFITVASARLQPGQLYQQTPTDVLVRESERLNSFPAAFGHWELQSDGVELTPNVQKELGLVNYVSRIYRNPETDREVAVLIMLGNTGRLVRHPPDICYSNRGSRTLAADETAIEGNGATHRFRILSYVSGNSLDENGQFVVAYGHAAGSQWDVPSFPRLTYGGEPFLYKMQVLVAEGTSIEDRIETARTFLTDYIKAFATMKNAEP